MYVFEQERTLVRFRSPATKLAEPNSHPTHMGQSSGRRDFTESVIVSFD